ncbi:hypothetical protein C8F04DRAFT_208163 [Mycena alexandri]|uniref:Uncharacterized protein n=1 Tax=Mycena alexandri TaxID=1745969 RepID=A0AAD6TK15_9AGAR|nr:hypothetical protein C8F04DRAFT_208163 [Mycena alexandri]
MSSRARAGGLPSGPGPRARSATRNRDADRGGSRYDDNDDGGGSSRSTTRQVRPQKSMTSMNQSRSGARAAPPMPSSRSRRDQAPSYDRSDSGTTNRSSDSTTASGSSFFDRMKQSAGYASSRTSFEDDEPDKRPARSRQGTRDESPPPADTPGDGFTLWSKIASTASSLTVNVGKAWHTNVTTFAGEETPVGQESRLTRAMKAYHLEKARDPADLPSWLFDEKERRRPDPPAPEASRSNRSRRRDDDDDFEEVPKAREPPQSRGLRDIYEAAAASTSTPSTRSTRGARSYADDTPPPSKATDRLKALRDAKRGALSSSARDEERGRDAPVEREPEAPPPRRRVGLPTGPVSRRL